MSKDTQKIVIVGAGVAVIGIMLYFVFAPASGSQVTYNSGNVLTTTSNPSTATQPTVQSAAITESQSLLNKWFGIGS